MTYAIDAALSADTDSKPKRLSATLIIHQQGADLEYELILESSDKACDANMLAVGAAMSFRNEDYREKVIRKVHHLLLKR